MSMYLKIHQGTGRLSGTHLCRQCVHSKIINEETICCQSYKTVRISKPVLSCNRFYSSSLPSLASFEELAWTLKTDGGRKVGFVPPEPKK